MVQKFGTDWFSYELVVPRLIEVGREYEFGNVHIVTRNAPSLRGAARAQVTIWQEIIGSVRPIELTLEKGRGVTYWDGFRELTSVQGTGAMCVLRGGLGFFSNVEFAGK